MENIMLQKRNVEMFPLLLGRECRRQQQVSSLIGNHLEKLQNKTKLIFLLFQHTCITGQELLLWIFWLWEGDLRKKGRTCSLIHSRWVSLICPGKLWTSVKKRIFYYLQKAMNIMLQFSTSHTSEQSSSMNIKSRLRKVSFQLKRKFVCTCLSRVWSWINISDAKNKTNVIFTLKR